MAFSRYLSVILASTALLLCGTSVLAAEFTIDVGTGAMGLEDHRTIVVSFDAQGDDINAIQGTVAMSGSALVIDDVSDGNSVMNFWVERPHIASDGKSIVFSGVTPGGYRGSAGRLFTMNVHAVDAGDAGFEVRDASALKDDGQGTAARLTLEPKQVISVVLGAPAEATATAGKDVQSPEAFLPEIGTSKELFDGRRFVVFSTQDKDSGIDHYEVCETLRPCVAAESPFLLRDQATDAEVVIKAFDKQGNVRVARIGKPLLQRWYEWMLVHAILTAGLLIVIVALMKLLWKKRS